VARAALQQAQANVREAELNLSYTTVTAPVSGYSGRFQFSEGALITANTSLLTTIVQLSPIWVRFSFSDNELAQLGGRLTEENVKEVTLVLPDGSEYPQKGKLNFAASQIDPLLGTQQLRATFDNADQKLLPGQFVRARVTTGQRDGVFLLPQVAVSTSDQGRFVFVVNEKNEATVRPVVVGDWVGKDWIILEGLNAGDKVIIDNIIKLRPGAPLVPNIAGEQPAEASPDAKEAPAQSLRTEPSTQA
jgi:membrane fusion protein (multidrug efflux system)